MLLDRVGVAQKLIDEVRAGTNLDKVTRTSERVTQLTAILESPDSHAKYLALKEINAYSEKEALVDERLLKALTSLTKPSEPVHIRLEAIRIIGGLQDSNFAYILEDLARDRDGFVAAKAIHSLTNIESSASTPFLLELFQGTIDPRLKNACLDFFARVAADSDAEALSVIATIEKHITRSDADLGAELRMARIVARQWGGDRDQIVDALLQQLSSPSSNVRTEVLNQMKEHGEMFVWRPEVRRRLIESLRRVFQKAKGTELANAWVVGLFWFQFNRQEVWSSILRADAEAIEAFFSEMEMYKLERVFDQPADVEQLAKLVQMVDGARRTEILDVLAELPSETVLRTMAKFKYEPKKWRAELVLRTFVELGKWSEKLNGLFEVALRNCGDDEDALAISLLAKHACGKVTTNTLIKDFPRKGLNGFRIERYQLRKYLEKIKTTTTGSQRQQLSRLLQTVAEEEE